MLIRVLTEPKNSLVKQFQQVLAMDGVELVIEPEALEAIADLALERGTGARGLRSILENVLLEPMYDVPGRSDVAALRRDRRVTVRSTRRPIYEIAKGDAHPSRELARALHHVRRGADVARVARRLRARRARIAERCPPSQPIATPSRCSPIPSATTRSSTSPGTNGKGTTTTLTSALLARHGTARGHLHQSRPARDQRTHRGERRADRRRGLHRRCSQRLADVESGQRHRRSRDSNC